MEGLPLITIGILVKNRAWCINRILEAVENVEYPKHLLKIVFVDDYSIDGTYELINEWSFKAYKKGFYKIEVIRARTNIPQARNLCIKRMEGKYLLFWDSDVIPPPKLLSEMINMMECNPDIGIIGADYVYEASTGIKYKPSMNKETHAVYMGFTLIRKEVFEKAGLFNENLSQGEDTEFCIRVKEKTSYRILWAPKPVLHLKKPEEVKRRGMLRSWMRYNFDVRAQEYYKSFNSLPRFLKLRIVYWLVWPWTIMIAVYYGLTRNVVLLILATVYVFLSTYSIVRQKGLAYGLALWAKGNVPTGLALSYGIVKELMKEAVRRLAKLKYQSYL